MRGAGVVRLWDVTRARELCVASRVHTLEQVYADRRADADHAPTPTRDRQRALASTGAGVGGWRAWCQVDGVRVRDSARLTPVGSVSWRCAARRMP